MSLKSKFRRFKGTQTREECIYFPKDRNELKDLIKQRVKEDPKCDLNDIWVGDIKDMTYLFGQIGFSDDEVSFNGDISRWDVSNVENMSSMFYGSIFNGDISNWNVCHVIDMNSMFRRSDFNSDIRYWDVSKVENMTGMFNNSKFNGDISEWDVSNVKTMDRMFSSCPFNGDISDWDVSNVENMRSMLNDCQLRYNPPKWYK